MLSKIFLIPKCTGKLKEIDIVINLMIRLQILITLHKKKIVNLTLIQNCSFVFLADLAYYK